MKKRKWVYWTSKGWFAELWRTSLLSANEEAETRETHSILERTVTENRKLYTIWGQGRGRMSFLKISDASIILYSKETTSISLTKIMLPSNAHAVTWAYHVYNGICDYKRSSLHLNDGYLSLTESAPVAHRTTLPLTLWWRGSVPGSHHEDVDLAGCGRQISVLHSSNCSLSILILA